MFAEPSTKLFDWQEIQPLSETQYCWETDPNMYADYAGHNPDGCPLRFCRDVLRAFGAFSGRQVLQKIIHTRYKVPNTNEVCFGHVTIRLSPRQPLIRSAAVDIHADLESVPVYIQRLREVTAGTFRDYGIQFFSRPASQDQESVFVGSSRDSREDGIEYWYRLKFRNEVLQTLEIMASGDGMTAFPELDKDREY
jgi:hypothetical protein